MYKISLQLVRLGNSFTIRCLYAFKNNFSWKKPISLRLDSLEYVSEWQPWPFIKHCVPEMFFQLYYSSNVPWLYLLHCIWFMVLISWLFHYYGLCCRLFQGIIYMGCIDNKKEISKMKSNICTLYTRTRLISN